MKHDTGLAELLAAQSRASAISRAQLLRLNAQANAAWHISEIADTDAGILQATARYLEIRAQMRGRVRQ